MFLSYTYYVRIFFSYNKFFITKSIKDKKIYNIYFLYSIKKSELKNLESNLFYLSNSCRGKVEGQANVMEKRTSLLKFGRLEIPKNFQPR